MKKGFTLIELLAVIVVLAIISVIAIPTLIGVVNKAKLSALKSSAYGLIEAGNLYNAQYGNSNNVRFDINNNIITSTEANKIKYKGNIKQGTVIVSSKGQITVCVTDGKNSAYKNYNDTEVTLASKKTCSIPASSYIVYLNGEATRSELSNQELTDQLAEVKQELNDLKNNLFDDIYPVGSVYVSVDGTNPNNKFKGTWEKIEGRFLLASDSNYTLGSTGGNSSVNYTPQGVVGDHTLTVNEMPSHTHSYAVVVSRTPNAFNSGTGPSMNTSPTNTSATGGNQPHNHPFTGTQTSIETMPPYVVVNVWKRTA